MRRRTIVLAGVGGMILAVGMAGGAVAVARVLDDPDDNVTGPAADAAAAAAVVAAGGGGRPTAIERDSEGDAVWEIEITRPDGTIAEVLVDRDNRVVVVKDGHEGDNSSDDRPDDDSPDDD